MIQVREECNTNYSFADIKRRKRDILQIFIAAFDNCGNHFEFYIGIEMMLCMSGYEDV